MLVFFLFILGLAVGSFLNVLIDRIPNDESPFAGRSYCDKCKKTLKWYDMVPVLSFLILKGKCRYCRAHISFYYPLVELITGIMFVLMYQFTIHNSQFTSSTIEQFSNLTINYLYYLFILSSFIVIFFTDLKYGIIPDKIVYPAIIISFFFLFFTLREFLQLRSGQAWLSFPLQPAILVQLATLGVYANRFLSALGSFAFFLILYLITRGKGMGFGDVKLAFLLGIILGFPKIIAAFYLAFLTGAIVGSILIVWGKKKLKGGTIPFGPFLIIGAVLSLFFGEKIIRLASLWLSF
ncbi:hypothetical protein A3F03_00750 [Candidatus Roizmanbacteria bacterium RIFCSPHIGHO2_12_FULL_41_11]|uniref:Prepilin peptidase n=1 Tax=Candidatus Roizmanbacteria bacterium RIFCSPHIGHO2_12_FULL_41_11 TaxID=1802052 RepID=A0A1F7I0G9_9BACT|nr:MAG: hypothetical protein A3F03_00750 [Candidatus Roizmanbacteria bacterium RIFCSPHIGHO2_12_FULL_41_11]